MKSGAELIEDERTRQIESEGFNSSHDDGNVKGELVEAAACYLMPPDCRPEDLLSLWPWSKAWWKPSPADRVRELVKSGALIAAEIDRLQRVATRNSGFPCLPIPPPPVPAGGYTF